LHSTKAYPEVALGALTLLFGMPLIRNKSERRKYGNDILQTAGSKFDKYSTFIGTLGQTVVMMQEFPYYYTNVNMSSEQLVNKYNALWTLITIYAVLGIRPGSGAVTAGVAEGIKTGDVKAGAKRAATRILNRGDIAEAIALKYPKATGAMWLAVAGAAISCASAYQQQAEIEVIIRYRYKNGQLSEAQYKLAFDTTIYSYYLQKFWEYR
jgi:hypothetical protein